MLDLPAWLGYYRGFWAKGHPRLIAKLKRVLASVAVCVVAAACTQNPPLESAGQPLGDIVPPLAAAPAAAPVFVPTPLPAPIPAPPEAPAKSADTPPPAATALVAPPAKEPQEIKEIEPPRPVDLKRPADDLWERIRSGFKMADLDSPLVGVRERWYASQPDYLGRIVERSKLYLYYIVEEVQKRGLPTEIALLPMVESAFNPMAYSRARASGLWQFMPSTGKKHQLTQNWWTDGRRDVVASTGAALDYLQALYELQGDWHLALASYNFGENGVTRAIKRNKAKGLPTDYLSLKMPLETRGYVPKLQALKNIILNPQKFGVTLEPIPNEPYFVTVPAEKDIDIRLAAQFADMSEDELIALNPALNRPIISRPHALVLVLPADRADAFQRNLDAYDQPLTSWQPYIMKKGDSIDRLAAKHGIALAKLKLANGVTSKTKVGPGFQLLLPIKGSDAAAQPLPAVFRQPILPAPRRGGIVHIVRKCETLYGISKRYRVSTDSLLRWNHIGTLTTGQRLILYRGSARTRTPAKPVKISAAPSTPNIVATLLPAERP